MDKRVRDATGVKEWRGYRAQFEVRALAGSKVELQGYASVYEEPYTMYDMFGPYEEVARAGMCAKTLSEGPAITYLANHEGLSLAKTTSGNLRVSEDTTGLLTVATVNTARSDARDLVTAIEDGDIDEMSFAFRCIRQSWSPDYDQRDLIEVSLDRGDVSAVNFGANPNTSVGATQGFRSDAAAKLHRAAMSIEARSMTVPSSMLEALDQLMNPQTPESEPIIENDEEEARVLAHLAMLKRQDENHFEKLNSRFSGIKLPG